LYPIQKLSFEVASVSSEIDDPVAAWRARSTTSASSHTVVSTTPSSADPSPSCTLPISAAFQYTTGAGLVETQRAVAALTTFYHHPPPAAEHVPTLTLGNADAVTKCFRLLGNPGDHFLADEFTFSSLANAAVPQGIKWVSVKIDEGGLIPEELEKTLDEWDDERGPRPHVLYTVP